jgi:acetyl esterase/lipase
MIKRVCFISVFVLILAVITGDSMAGIREVKDLHYHSDAELAAGDDYMRSQCVMDLKYPEDQKGYPVVVWFHGGGLEGGRKHYPELPGNIAVVAVGYRLSPKVTVPVFLEDAAASIAWVYQNIASYGGDASKIFISGHSAGGYLSAMVGMDPKWLARHGVDHKTLAGIIPVSGQVTTHFNVKKWLGDAGPQFRPLINEYAPLFYVDKDLPPICLITGGRAIEYKCRVEENELLAISLKQTGSRMVEFHEMGGLDHGSVGQGSMLIIPGFIKRVLEAK